MDEIQKIIVQSAKELPFEFNEKDILIISEWWRWLFQDWYKAGKKITTTLLSRKK